MNDKYAWRLLYRESLFCIALNVPTIRALVLVVPHQVLRAAKVIEAFLKCVITFPFFIFLLWYVHGDAIEVFIGAGSLHACEALDLTSALAAKNLKDRGICLISKHETQSTSVQAGITQETRVHHCIDEL